MICGFSGSGLVGKIAVDHLIQEFNSEKIGTIYSDLLPPRVYVKDDGSADLVKHEIYRCTDVYKRDDLLLYTGDFQPVTVEAEFELATKILDTAIKMGVRMIYTLAAYITGQFIDKPMVYGTGTDKAILDRILGYQVKKMPEGSIRGMNGLLIGMAKIKEIDGMCLLGETSGYIMDAKASQAVLDSLSRILRISIDMTKLEARAKETEILLQRINDLGPSGRQQPISGDQDLAYIS